MNTSDRAVGLREKIIFALAGVLLVVLAVAIGVPWLMKGNVKRPTADWSGYLATVHKNVVGDETFGMTDAQAITFGRDYCLSTPDQDLLAHDIIGLVGLSNYGPSSQGQKLEYDIIDAATRHLCGH